MAVTYLSAPINSYLYNNPVIERILFFILLVRKLKLRENRNLAINEAVFSTPSCLCWEKRQSREKGEKDVKGNDGELTAQTFMHSSK